jgi:hypothetical protein
LLGRLREAVPADWQVVVLTDRGLESPRLFRAILEQGWHPLMRVKRGGKFRPHGWHGWYTMAEFLRQRGDRWVQAGVAYKGELLACTLLACWDEGYEEPWLLLTDLPPGAATPCWYAWRAWIEQGFKVLKSQGLNWQHTRMTQPERAERLFLVLAVTVLWLVVVGAEVEHDALVETMGAWKSGSGGRPRRHRLFECGRAAVIAALLCSVVRYGGKLLPQNWPETWDIPTVTEEEFILKRDLQL